MAVPPAPDDRSGVTPETQLSTHDTPTGSGGRRLIAAVLVILVLVSAGTLAWLLVQRSDDTSDLQSQREKVMSQARQFVLRVNTYGPDLLDADGTMPDYRRLVGEVITSKFSESFDQSVPAAEATVSQAKYGRTAEVFGAGVSVIDSDSATALVAGSFTSSYPAEEGSDERVDDVPLPFRVQVELVKVDGEWLVDGFAPVTGEAPEEEPTGAPSASPVSPGQTPSATPPSASPSEGASP